MAYLDNSGVQTLVNKLKTKITTLLQNYVSKSGDTMTGELTTQTEMLVSNTVSGNSISLKSNDAGVRALKAYNSSGNSNIIYIDANNVATFNGNAENGNPITIRKGDSVSISNLQCVGFVTDSSKEINFLIPLARAYQSGLTATFSTLTLTARGVQSGYILNQVEVVGASGYTITTSAYWQYGVRVKLTKSSVFQIGTTTVTNNTVCVVMVNSGTFTLN